MRPSADAVAYWHEAHHALAAAPAGSSVEPAGSVIDALDYTPSANDQFACGDCWAWAGTSALDIELNRLHGNGGPKVELSVQWLDSLASDPTMTAGISHYSGPCCGGTLDTLATVYHKAGDRAVPNTNTNANFQDGTRSDTGGQCESLVSYQQISTANSITFGSLSALKVQTHGVGEPAAISNLKSVIDSGKGIYLGFYLPDQAAWNEFNAFWDSQDEASIWNPTSYCGEGYNPACGAAGHAVLVTGYADDGTPDGSYWTVLNSWGTAGGTRPNGTFRLQMHGLNYDCAYNTGSGALSAFMFEVLNVAN